MRNRREDAPSAASQVLESVQSERMSECREAALTVWPWPRSSRVTRRPVVPLAPRMRMLGVEVMA
ncbi:hypothetical protein [Myxococcus fulvus]|uniref:hypothetical protein n=1 Tax=Myxococcus fulvus TaxID=33 RepID=UPI0020BF1E0A|nr:hypothetical protein [Myxococcus fulvus]MCK8497406.1 hypothetical protein [Myxococcus fulvus]